MSDAAKVGWTKLVPLAEPVHSGCLLCGSKPIELPLTKMLCVGFGDVTVSRDEEIIWQGDDDSVTLERFEEMAKLDPDHNWHVTFNAPLWEGIWQRQDGKWLLVWKGMGFA